MSLKMLERMRRKRDALSVLRLKFLKFRSRCRHSKVFAFEGVDDRGVWSRWIFRHRPQMEFEPFICDGKREARKLSRILETDRGGMGTVKIFIDRDYDDLDGFSSLNQVFVPDRYSFENYFLDRDLLNQSLRDDLGCNGLPELRTKILNTFFRDLSAFESIIRPYNRRLFVSSRCNIRRISRLGKIAPKLACIGVGKVSPTEANIADLVRLDHEPNLLSFSLLEDEFRSKIPRLHYRGKDLYNFLLIWFDKLRGAAQSGDQSLPGLCDLENPRFHQIDAISLAAKSPMPAGLAEFLA